ncbi:MAG: hypothetical protein RMJ66_01325 [Bacteroidia bacterium]|nr:hypothetical protein [Bacteroidia bacterium]MDW8133685.1 hypothetical protein [Bacteroidia bacterium]
MDERLIANLKNQLIRGSSTLYNEHAIYFGVIVPVLNDLKWNTSDTEEIVPQYATDEGRVDFALRPIDKQTGRRANFTFIEVKQLGKADEEAERQLFRYAFHEGVPLLILTDGARWRFYHPLSAGSLSERMIEEINLLSDPEEKCTRILQKYLERSRYLSVRDFDTFIKQEYNAHVQYQTFRRIWQTLVTGEDTGLIELILNRLASSLNVPINQLPIDKVRQWLTQELSLSATPPLLEEKQRGLYIKGTFYAARRLKDLGRILCEKLAEIDSSFPENFYHSRENKGSKRLYISPDPDKMFPATFREKRPDWQQYLVRFTDKQGKVWWLMTHFSQKTAKDLFKRLTLAVGLPWENPQGVKVIL